jgi:tRNA-dihydrouridine synthase B
MYIGKLKLKSRILLAPMLEPNDIAFRLLCKKSGCGLAYTGMTSPMTKKELELDDKPAMQIFGNSTRGIEKFIKRYDKKVSLWDFNLGCPSKLSKRLEHGAFMHDDISIIEKILKVMRRSTKKPISIKLRKSEKAIEIAKLAEKYVDAVGIHPRTFGQGYSGKPDYNFAVKLKSEIKVPVIYSGDVKEENVKKILEDFDFVFVGREAIGDSGIFARMRGENSEVNFNDYLKLSSKYKLFFRQIKYQAMNFTKGLSGAKKIRAKLVEAKTIEDVKEIMTKNK